MILKPGLEDLRVILYHIGKIIIGVSLCMVLPLLTSVVFKEEVPFIDFVASLGFSLSVGFLLTLLFKTKKEIHWMHGMVIVSVSWLVLAILGAVPLYLSGHWRSFLDAVFDAMSGYTTTGLTLAQDLDHLSMGHQMWRHLIMFIGGQGIVIVALGFLAQGTGGAFRIYAGEARDEKILPNVVGTARFIWMISISYLILGTLILGLIAIWEGIAPLRAFFHGVWIFMAAFDTGGFAPQSQNILYYHSFLFEIGTILMMVLGIINFKLHFSLWTGNRRTIWRDIEIISLTFTILISFFFVALGLAKADVYPQAIVLLRKGFYQLISGHTGTGYMTLYARQFMQSWPHLALVSLIMAMGLGGAMCSTTGGIKALRIGLVFKAFIQDVKQLMHAETAVLVEKFHHIKDLILEDRQVRSAALIFLAYIGLYLLGSFVGMLCGYPFLESLFESTSAAANVGLSCGLTGLDMPGVLKLTYIFQMWIGRLEFVAVFTLIGFIIALFKGK
jgi:trk system potassium uptake protein TrkH